MPLPSLDKIIPQFDIVIPSTGEDKKFRPFLVKEEKLLLIAQESNEDRIMLDSIIQVITSCALVPLRVEDLAHFDIEYIFLQLRAKSVSEQVDLGYKCHNDVPVSPEAMDKWIAAGKEGSPPQLKCGNIVKLKINLNEVAVQTNPEHTKTIFLTDTMGVNMRYPNTKMAKQMLGVKHEGIVEALQSIAMCIESVFDEESVYTNFQLKEIQDWIERLTQAQFTKLQAFFETMPKLAHDVEFHCNKCGYSETLHLEGLPTFFG